MTDPSERQPPLTPPTSGPESIVPPSVASALEALVFTDIVNSTGIKARISTQSYIEELQRHNALFAQCVAMSTGATIVKHTGDGLFARFQTASEAVRCMLRFQRLMAKEIWTAEPLTCRVGIHLGEFALVQMADRADVVGTPADTAARIMSLGTAGQILLSRLAADEARRFLNNDSFRWTRHGYYPLKGASEPIEIWEAAESRTTPLAAPAGAVPGPTAIPPGDSLEASPHNRLRYYKILERLGEGGMGAVFKAQQTTPIKRTVALKRVKPGLDSHEVIARFESERQALALMKHPHIAEVYDAGTDELGHPYFVMEYVEGVPITQYADNNRLTNKQRLELFLQVCEAIAHAHAKAVIHRDITARNVLAYTDKVTGKPMAKVIDFGIAKALSGDHFTDRTLNTLSGHAIGTLGSMSPEQAAGSADIDTRSDVYSLGVLLYELLTGAPPFDPKALQQAAFDEARRIIREVEPPRPSTRLVALGETAQTAATARRTELQKLSGSLKDELEWIPLKALRKERDRRYPSSMALADDIRNYLDGKPLAAGPESSIYLAKKFIRRHRAAVAAAAAVVLALGIGLGAAVWQANEAAKQRDAAVIAQQNEAAQRTEAVRQRDEADRQRQLAEAEKVKARKQSYFAAISAAWARYEQGQMGEVRRLLDEAPAEERNWEWGHLRGLSDPSLLQLRGHEQSIYSVVFSPDGTRIATASIDRTARVWDAATGEVVVVLKGHESAVYSIAFSPDGRNIITSGEDKTVRIWDTMDGNQVAVHSLPSRAVYSAAFSPDSSRIVVALSDNTARILDRETGGELVALRGHVAEVRFAAFSNDGSKVVTASLDKTARVWDSATGKELKMLLGHAGMVASALFSPDDALVITASGDSTSRLWDAKTGRELTKMVGATQGINNYARFAGFSSDSSRVVVASGDGIARIWNASTGKEITALIGHGQGVRCAAFSPDGSFVITASDDGVARLWDATDGQRILTTVIPTVGSRTTGYSPDQTRVVMAAARIEPVIVDVASGATLAVLRGHENYTLTASYSPDGRRIITGSMDDTARVWDAATGKQLAVLSGHEEMVFSAAFSPDGTRVVTGSVDETARVWHVETGEVQFILESHRGTVSSVAFAPDGTRVVTTSSDDSSRVWDANTGHELLVLRGHTGFVNSATFSPDGSRIVTGSDDCTVRVWDTSSGREVAVLHADGAPVSSVGFYANGTNIFCLSKRNTFRIWTAESAAGRYRQQLVEKGKIKRDNPVKP